MADETEYRVGDHLVRPSLSEIRVGDEHLHVEPRPMAVLVELCRQAPRVVSKQELIEAVWGEAFVSDEVLTHAIWELRRAFGDDASSPRFIRTIPKKGYRLIAEVEALEPDPRGGRRRVPQWQRVVLWLMAALAVAVAATWLRQAWTGETEDGAVSLVLVPPPPSDTQAEAARRLGDDLVGGLSGIARSTAKFSRGECEGRSGWTVYCLAVALRPGAAGLEAQLQLVDAETGHHPFSTRWVELDTPGHSEPAAVDLVEQVATFLEVRQHDFFTDPDVAPFFEVNRHDIRAIRDFFLGLDYSFRDEPGSVDSWESAIAIDPNYVAPHVSRTPSIWAARDPEAIAAHRARLARLLESANSFEKPMLRWARALLDMPADDADPRFAESFARQKRQLEVALEQEEGNRFVRSLLATVLTLRGRHQEAWSLLEPLVEEGWRHPDHYPHAAKSALELGRLKDARDALERGLEHEIVAPETYTLLVLFEVYDGDFATAAEYLKRFRAREADQAPDPDVFDWAYYAELLAAEAERRGAQAAAQRLREFRP